MAICRGALAVAALAFASAWLPGTARASLLMPGDILRVEFSTLDPLCPGGPCDVLTVMPVDYGSWGAGGGSAALYDGSLLLGTHDTPELCCVWDFVSSSSLFTARSPAVVDFHSILNGIVGGRIDLRIYNGLLTFPGGPAVRLEIGRAAGPGVVEAGSGIFITSTGIVPGPLFPPPGGAVPEPGSAWLVAGGAVLIAAGSFRRTWRRPRG
ncbi:MAG: hypothetical protein IT158_24465 [Bryobacterales bacterium]|nr:hypothetical protein [Bryobacterales bacterium]